MRNRKGLYQARKKFLGECPICGTPLKKVDGVNILRCENSNCTGVAIHKKGKTSHEPYYKILNGKGMEIYEHLFKQK